MQTLSQARHISKEDRKLLEELKQVIHQFLPTAEIFLYGSVARGAPTSESDYDVLVLMDQSLDREHEDAVRDAVYDLELVRGILISLVFCTRDHWDRPLVRVSPFRQEVERDAIRL